MTDKALGIIDAATGISLEYFSEPSDFLNIATFSSGGMSAEDIDIRRRNARSIQCDLDTL
jgi:hypothetical protein